jgi:hypothetical protein
MKKLFRGRRGLFAWAASVVMLVGLVAEADTLFSGLTAGGAISSTDLFACYQGANPVKSCAASAVQTFIFGQAHTSGDLGGTIGAPTINSSAVTNAKQANMAAHTIKGNNTAGSAAPLDLTDAQVITELGLIPSTTSALAGDGAGKAVAITGTGSNCVHVDGTSSSCTSGSATGFGVNGGTNFTSVTGTGAISGTPNFVYIASGWATGTLTLPQISALTNPNDHVVCVIDSKNFVDLTHTLTVAANGTTPDTVNNAASIGALTSSGGALCFVPNNTTHNWSVLSGATVAASTAPSHQFASSVGLNGLGYAQPSSSDLSDVANLAFLNVNQSFTKGQAVTPTTGGTQSAGGTLTPDFSLANSVTATFGAGNLTIANPTNVKAGQQYVLSLTQDGTGSRTVTWGANYKWQGGTAPTLSTAASAKDIISCWADTTTTINCTLAVKGAS